MPIITTTLSEFTDATSTDIVAIKYTGEEQDGVFDFYEFSIDGLNRNPQRKEDNDKDRSVRFSDLEAGKEYTVEAKVFSGAIASSTQKSIKVTTSKFNIDLSMKKYPQTKSNDNILLRKLFFFVQDPMLRRLAVTARKATKLCFA